jgi:signal transduction histidine kinase
VIVLAGSMMSLLGYGYGANNLYGVGSFIPMALHTAALLTVAGTALLFAGGEHGVLAILSERGSGSVMARRLLPAAVVIPCLLGFARIFGQRAGWYESEFGTALMVVVTVALLVVAVVFTAGVLNRMDTERQQATDSLRRSSEQIQLLNGSLERRVAERTAELAEANRDLALKNQENEMFVYSVSHDLRSPLVNLQGFSKELDAVAVDVKTLLNKEGVPEAVRTEATALLDGDVKQALHFIQTAVGRLGSIIEALLRLSRVGRVEYQNVAVDMNALVTRIVESMSAGLYDAEVNVQVHELPPCVGDVGALEQLFANLLGNAVKYRDPARATVIEVGTVRDPATAGIHAYFVRDNGLGIPPSHQEKIFQAFKRAHPNVASGEGMGLAIVRRIVQRHGGAISVESAEGRGSTFVVTLPAAAGNPPATSRSPLRKGEPEHGSRTHGDLVGGRR